MTTIAKQVLKCDRCGFEKEGERPEDWMILDYEAGKDLCDYCKDDLKSFLSNKAVPVRRRHHFRPEGKG